MSLERLIDVRIKGRQLYFEYVLGLFFSLATFFFYSRYIGFTWYCFLTFPCFSHKFSVDFKFKRSHSFVTLAIVAVNFHFYFFAREKFIFFKDKICWWVRLWHTHETSYFTSDKVFEIEFLDFRNWLVNKNHAITAIWWNSWGYKKFFVHRNELSFQKIPKAKFRGRIRRHRKTWRKPRW